MSCEEHVQTPPKKYKSRKKEAGGEYKEKANEFKVRPRPGTALYEIYFEEGGQIADTLKGAYTSTMTAQKDIKLYESSRRQYY